MEKKFADTMGKKFADIINEGKKNGDTIEVINTKLKEVGAIFCPNPDGGVVYWSSAELAEGFIPAATEPEDVKHLYDYMRYSKENAGKTIRISAPEGTYDVTWDEDGHPFKAVRCHD